MNLIIWAINIITVVNTIHLNKILLTFTVSANSVNNVLFTFPLINIIILYIIDTYKLYGKSKNNIIRSKNKNFKINN